MILKYIEIYVELIYFNMAEEEEVDVEALLASINANFEEEKEAKEIRIVRDEPEKKE